MERKIGSIEVFENQAGNITILDNDNDWAAIEIDECMAEKLCKAIMAVAKEMREEK